MAALGVGEGPQIAEYPLLRMLPNGAGIHHHQVRPFGPLAKLVAAGGEQPPNPLGVRLILLAAVGLHIGQGPSAPAMPIGLHLVAQGQLGLHLILGDYCRVPIQWGYLRCIKNHVF